MRNFEFKIIYRGKKHPDIYNKKVTIKNLLKISPFLSERVLIDRCWSAYDRNKIAGQDSVTIFDNHLTPVQVTESKRAMSERLVTHINNEWLKRKIV